MSASHNSEVTFDDVKAAAGRIQPYAHKTPVLTSHSLDSFASASLPDTRLLYFKCEQYQKGGAFKFRGACNAVFALSDADAARGVVTHSSGNHAQALALAAQIRGITAYVVMPENAPAVKKKAVEGYGGSVRSCASTVVAREQTCAQVQAETGATFVAPYDNRMVIAGQGTAAMELLADIPDLDAIIVPVGGGGLLSGTCITAKGIKPTIRIFGAEPLGADDAKKSLAEGRIVPQTNPQTIADGLRTSLGELTFPVIQKHVEKIITVTEEEIYAATRLLWERLKVVTEPSGAVPLAVALSQEFKSLTGIKKVGLIMSGGNIDLDSFKWPQGQ